VRRKRVPLPQRVRPGPHLAPGDGSGPRGRSARGSLPTGFNTHRGRRVLRAHHSKRGHTMNAIVATPALRDRWSQIVERVSSWTPDALLSLGARLSLGAIFFMSGRTKVEGFLTVTDGAYALFRDEYKVPFVPPEFAAHMA